LLDAYRSAANGTIPHLQQAPLYFWEVCYALKPKTENFKTGRVNYTVGIVDTLDEVNPPVQMPMGPTEELYHIFWGMAGPNEFNGFYQLQGPSAAYTEALGEGAIKSLWQTFTNDGMNRLIGDPGTKAWLLHDTSCHAANYPEFGDSYGAPGGCALTSYSERYIECPVLAKFSIYQEFEFGWRGWHEFKKTSGSATYIGPRCTELQHPVQLRNKVSPIFLIYNFDEYVEVGALWIARVSETLLANSTTAATVPAYPLTSQQFQILLRQSIINYFSNEMAQDLRVSAVLNDDILINMLPLSVGPNGHSITSVSEGMRMPRFFVEMVRCAKRLTSVLRNRFNTEDKNSVIDLVPVLCRPGEIPQLGQYTWNVETPVFKVNAEEIPVDLIECSINDASVTKFLNLNGTEIGRLAEAHNDWVSKVTNAATSMLDLASIESGIPALNCNVVTNHLNYIFNVTSVTSAPTEETKGKQSQPRVPLHRGRYGVRQPKAIMSSKLERKQSQKNLKKGITVKRKVGAFPDVGSNYFQINTGVVKCTGMLPFYAPLWKYQQAMVKPLFWVVAQSGPGSSLQYQTVQVQPHSLPIAMTNPIFTVEVGDSTMPSLFDQHLMAANLDVRAVLTQSESEMEVDFKRFQEQGEGGFFSSLGKAIGGFVDGALGV
jgi:hypothetical protein